jgi:rhodanese-related sulfurtransferase
MKGKRIRLLIFAVWLALVAGNLALAAPPPADKMTKEELLPLLGNPEVTIIDLRFGREWSDSSVKIKGAIREDPLKPGQWTDKYQKEKMLVFYCDCPDDGTSASLARVLKMRGYLKVYYLKGGWAEWTAAKYPTDPKGPG